MTVGNSEITHEVRTNRKVSTRSRKVSKAKVREGVVMKQNVQLYGQSIIFSNLDVLLAGQQRLLVIQKID